MPAMRVPGNLFHPSIAPDSSRDSWLAAVEEMRVAREFRPAQHRAHQVRTGDLADAAMSLHPSHPDHRRAVGNHHGGIGEGARHARILPRFQNAVDADSAHVSFHAIAEVSSPTRSERAAQGRERSTARRVRWRNRGDWEPVARIALRGRPMLVSLRLLAQGSARLAARMRSSICPSSCTNSGTYTPRQMGPYARRARAMPRIP